MTRSRRHPRTRPALLARGFRRRRPGYAPLRAAGWPAPEDPDSGEDTELGGRDNIADRLSDEVSWQRQCADWLAHLDADSCPPAVNLRPSADWPDRAIVAVDLARVRAVIDRIAADLDELARARRVQDLNTAAVLSDPRAERRRRLAEPDLEFRAFCARKGLPASSTRNWNGPGTHGRPSGTGVARSASGRATPTTRSGHADHPPTVPAFRKLDTIAVLTARLLPAPLNHPGTRRKARNGRAGSHRQATTGRLGECRLVAGLEVTAGGQGIVSHAGLILLWAWLISPA